MEVGDDNRFGMGNATKVWKRETSMRSLMTCTSRSWDNHCRFRGVTASFPARTFVTAILAIVVLTASLKLDSTVNLTHIVVDRERKFKWELWRGKRWGKW